ncbi:MAG: BspA family leucine-rich repeat surface protein [Lachnospiraceae bacterium]|nr:BspA family leucine-rich repeat surface protein [Lachnospiraceae bacterium]
MARKWIQKLGMGISVLMSVSQISGMAAFAAHAPLCDDEPEFEDLLEEKYEDVTDQEYIADEGDTEFEEFYTDANATRLSGDNDVFGTDGEDSISLSVEEWLNDYNYDISDYFKRVSIYSSKGTFDSEKVVIPAYTEINGEQYRVVIDTSQLHKNGIEDSVWNADREIEEIVIEKGVILVYGCNLFRNMNHLKKLDIRGLDTSQAVNMDDMFYGCSELKNLDVSGFDTSHVKSMSGMFYGCSRLKALDVHGFETANVNAMNEMFCGCSKISDLDLSCFDTSNVTDMHSMFEGCEKLTELDLSGFDVQKVTDCSSLFKDSTALKKADLSSFKICDDSPDLEDMFKNCSSLEMIKVPLYIPENSEIVLPDTFYDSTGKSYKKLKGPEIEESYWIGKEGISVPERPEIKPQSIELSTNVLDLVAGQTEGLSFRIAPEDTANKNVIWSSSNEQVATVSEDGFVTAVEAGTAKITATTEVKGLTASCDVTVIRVYGKEFRQDEQGAYCYYVDGLFQKDISGFVDWDGSKFFLVNGVIDNSANGLVNDIDHPEDWYYCSGGQVQTQYTGLAEYDGAWFYINQGRLDTTLTAYVEYDGGLFYVAAGRILTEVNGLALDPNSSDWYYLANGQVQLQYTGLTIYDEEWFFVQNGKLVPDYTGNVEYDGVVFEMRNGKLFIPEEETGAYVIDKTNRRFHKPSCPVVDGMDPYNRLYVSNTSAQELKDAGCKPCETCDPK